MAVFTSSHEADCPSPPDIGTDLHATSTENAFLVPEGVPDLLDPAAHCDVLNGTGIWGLCYQQFCEVTAQSPYPICIGADHHAVLHVQGTGCGDLGIAVIHMFHNAKPAGAGTRQIFHTTQVGYADAILKRVVQYTAPFWCVDDGSIDINLY